MKKFVLLVVVVAFSFAVSFKGAAFGAVSTDEVSLLQKLSQQLEESARAELDKVQKLAHSGRYQEDTLSTQLGSFVEASKTLNTKVAATPPSEKEINPTIAELKSLVVSIDDVFVYESGYDHIRRDWNECKRILRRIDGIVYREGPLRRLENIIDSNQFFKDTGYFFQIHGLLANIEDTLHGDKMAGPINDIVGRHGGGRNNTNVWIIPQPSQQSQSTQGRSSFNEDLSEL